MCYASQPNSFLGIYKPLFYLIVFSVFLFIVGCSSEKTDEELLQQDNEELAESLDGFLVNNYKLLKTCVRIIPVLDTTLEDHKAIKAMADIYFPELLNNDTVAVTLEDTSTKAFTAEDIVAFLKYVVSLKSFCKNNDEDDFPTIIEGECMRSGDSVEVFFVNSKTRMAPPLQGEVKLQLQSFEHAAISTFMFVDRSKNFTKDMLLYECYKTNTALLGDSEIKCWLQMLRGFLFYDQGLLYLAENELTNNIEWLDKNPKAEMDLTQLIVLMAPIFLNTTRPIPIEQETAYYSMHITNHLFRAVSRLSMERDIDEERAMQDFEVIIEDAKIVGLDNELVWTIETYLYLHQGKNEEAIESLSKLKSSSLLTVNERAAIDEALIYIENKAPDKVLNGFFDKFFLNKLLIKYIYGVASDLDWMQLMKELGITNSEELNRITNGINDFVVKVSGYANSDSLSVKGELLEEKGLQLFDKIRDL